MQSKYLADTCRIRSLRLTVIQSTVCMYTLLKFKSCTAVADFLGNNLRTN